MDIVWVFNGGAKQWREQLPEDGRAAADRVKDLPYLATTKLSYNKEEVFVYLSMLMFLNTELAMRFATWGRDG